MRSKRYYVLLCFIIIDSIGVTFSKHNNHTKAENSKKPDNGRNKRALSPEEEETPFWPNRGKKLLDARENYDFKYDDELVFNNQPSKSTNMENKLPFWGNRGRRETLGTKSQTGYICKNCNNVIPFIENGIGKDNHNEEKFITSRDNFVSEEMEKSRITPYERLWKNRHEENSQENVPFWGQRGRRENEGAPFWGNRGRRQEEENPFWGNRGRRDKEEEPFWGNRGRRDEEEQPFWGNRGRRQEPEPFWGSRGRRRENDPIWGATVQTSFDPIDDKQELKNSLSDAINSVKLDIIGNLVRLRRRDENFEPRSFQPQKARNTQLKGLFQGTRHKNIFKPIDSNTVLNDKIFVQQPHYILVERVSRSSGESDPFFISRGKKKFLNHRFVKTSRNRRGAVEEIVKSVRNDPYYLARGKKQMNTRTSNSTSLHDEFSKVKDLICATLDLMILSKGDSKEKRDIDDSERDRRTILKKLTAQLQNDPYFVTRGKKYESDDSNDSLEEFITDVTEKCTY